VTSFDKASHHVRTHSAETNHSELHMSSSITTSSMMRFVQSAWWA
jgi:hypothetical protein